MSNKQQQQFSLDDKPERVKAKNGDHMQQSNKPEKKNKSLQEAARTGDVSQFWRKKDKIREMFCPPNITPEEFDIFVGMGMSLGANPFNREIFIQKFGGDAQIFLGRDFYRRKAEEQENYDGHIVMAVYQNDTFQIKNGRVEHTQNIQDRGSLMGAYCEVYRKNTSVPYPKYVEFKEYYAGRLKDPYGEEDEGNIKKKNNGQPYGKTTWDDKPRTMIEKVAEAQGLRGAFQGVFKGTYDESEYWRQQAQFEEQQEQKQQAGSGDLDDTLQVSEQ